MTPNSLDYSAPPRRQPRRHTAAITIICALFGAMLGLICGGLGVGLSGFGHGGLRRSRVADGPRRLSSRGRLLGSALSAGKGLALLLLVAAVVGDVLLVSMTNEEGTEYFDRVCSHAPGLVLAWAVLWLGWQVWALAAIIWPGRSLRDRSNS